MNAAKKVPPMRRPGLLWRSPPEKSRCVYCCLQPPELPPPSLAAPGPPWLGLARAQGPSAQPRWRAQHAQHRFHCLSPSERPGPPEGQPWPWTSGSQFATSTPPVPARGVRRHQARGCQRPATPAPGSCAPMHGRPRRQPPCPRGTEGPAGSECRASAPCWHGGRGTGVGGGRRRSWWRRSRHLPSSTNVPLHGPCPLAPGVPWSTPGLRSWTAPLWTCQATRPPSRRLLGGGCGPAPGRPCWRPES
mmetsp:Transcript_81111/g.217926  ORF Transcript_81111/g.217926 Transcript_81111/m.217926 type:complete len:247 (-) Transcript_81111:1636-2376(-)